jgi:hypothetical protein
VVTSDDDDDDDVESVIYYPKNPSCTLYVTLNVKKIQKLVRVFDRWQKRETTQNSSHIIACASERRFKTNVLLLLSQ